MDEGRYKDLARLDKILQDDSKSYRTRQRAYFAKEKIVAQLKDRKLTELRHRLIKASQAGDEWNEWKIGNLIKEHVKQNRLEIPS